MADDLLPLLVSPEDVKWLESLKRRKYTGSGGIEVAVSPDGGSVAIMLRRRSGAGGDEGSPIRDAKITAKSAINGAIRWKYTIELGHWDMATAEANGGTWVKDSGTAVLYAFNSAEDMNTFTGGTGGIGTGNTSVAQSDGTVSAGSCALLPLPVGGFCQVKLRGAGALQGSVQSVYYTILNFANSAEQ